MRSPTDIGYDPNRASTEFNLTNSEPLSPADSPSRNFLPRSQAFEWTGDSVSTSWRIVEVSVDERTSKSDVLAIQLNTKRLIFKTISLETFSGEMAAQHLYLIDDPWAALWKNKVPSKSACKRRDDRYETILPLIKKRYWTMLPSILQAEVNDLATIAGRSDRSIEQLLREYLQNGQSRHALTPLWFNSGKGKRATLPGGKKRGRPGKLRQIDGTELFETGCNISTQIETEFKIIYDQFVKSGTAKSDEAAHSLVIIFFYSNSAELIYDLDIKPVIERPSLDSYRKWRQKSINRIAHNIAKRGETDYLQNHRSKLGTSRDQVPGPYKLWQTDVKTIRCYITTPLAPGFVIKMVSFCLFVDCYDSSIPGFYVGPERESQIVYLLALQDATKDGLVPDGIFGDRGPIEGEKTKALIRDITIDEIHNAPPFRPDMKGLVESLLHVIVKLALRWYPKAAVQLEKGDAQHVLPVCLSLTQLRQLIAIAIRQHNNMTWLKHYPVPIESLPEMIEKTPMGLRQHGFDLYGEPRIYSSERIKQSALKVGRGSISAKGLKNMEFKADCHYTSEAIKPLIDRASIKKETISVEIRYNPSIVDTVSVVINGEFFECFLIEDELGRMFKGRDITEIMLYNLFDQVVERKNSDRRLLFQLKSDLEAMSIMIDNPNAEALMKAKGITPKQFANLVTALQSLPSGDAYVTVDASELSTADETKWLEPYDNTQTNSNDYSDLFGLEPHEARQNTRGKFNAD